MKKWHIATWMVAILMLGAASNTGAAPVYPTLSLPSSYTGLRMLQGVAATPGSSEIGISLPRSTIAGDFVLSSPTMNIVPSSGVVRRGRLRPIPFAFGWTDTSTLGPQAQSTITLTGHDVDPGNDQMTVDGVVVANRQLTVDRLGTPATPQRVMLRQPYTTTMYSGSNPSVDGDDYATRLNTKSRARASSTDGNDMLARYKGTPLAQFNDVNQSADIDVIFYRTGNINDYYDLAPDLLKDGESTLAGATLQSAILNYNVDVLKQRRLRPSKSRVNFGNVLKGAVMGQDVIMNSRNKNPDIHHTTSVTVSVKGGSPVVTSVGELAITPTLVDADGVPLTVTGTFNTYGTLRSLRGLLAVATAEVGIDTKPYRDVRVSYSANVGLAKIGRTRGSFDGAMVLSAFVQSGGTLAGLASKVKPRRTLAEDMTSPVSVTQVTYNARGRASRSNLRGLYRVVGSEAEIVASTDTAADTPVTMQWRRRTLEEAHTPRRSGDLPITPGEAPKWLTSDVVKIEGVTSDIVYALQMTFDNRINLALDGQVGGQLDQEWQDMWIAQMNTGETMWERAALGAGYGHYQSLSDFLLANSGLTLDLLEGHWGVDPAAASDPQQRGHSWAIIRGGGSGVFAVVPEPATLLLLISAMAGLFAYMFRRYRDFFRLQPVAVEAETGRGIG